MLNSTIRNINNGHTALTGLAFNAKIALQQFNFGLYSRKSKTWLHLIDIHSLSIVFNQQVQRVRMKDDLHVKFAAFCMLESILHQFLAYSVDGQFQLLRKAMVQAEQLQIRFNLISGVDWVDQCL